MLCVQAEMEGEIDRCEATQCERCDQEREKRSTGNTEKVTESALIDTPVMIKAKETMENFLAF